MEQPTGEDADKFNWIFNRAKKQAQELSLVAAQFRCQNPECYSEKELQAHHLIMRKAKYFMAFNRYASQRYYWANIIMLCCKCHKKYHYDLGEPTPKVDLYIPQETIDKIKEKYKYDKDM